MLSLLLLQALAGIFIELTKERGITSGARCDKYREYIVDCAVLVGVVKFIDHVVCQRGYSGVALLWGMRHKIAI